MQLTIQKGILGSVMIAMLALGQGQASAQFGGIGGGILDNTPFDPDTWTELDPSNYHFGTSFKVYFKNHTNETIYVAWGRHTHCGSDGGIPVFSWKYSGWYRLDPYERAYVGNAKSRYMYVYAKGRSGQWIGDHRKRKSIAGRWQTLDFRKVNMGSTYGKFTYNFRD